MPPLQPALGAVHGSHPLSQTGASCPSHCLSPQQRGSGKLCGAVSGISVLGPALGAGRRHNAPHPPPCPSRPAGYRPAWGSYQLRRGPSKAGRDLACRVSVQQAHSFYCKCVVVRAGRGPQPLGSREGSLLDTPSLTGRPQELPGPKGLNPQGPGLLGLPRTRAGPPPGPGAKLGDSNNGESWGSPLCPVPSQGSL